VKRLEDMTLGQRIMLTLVIALVILFALALVGWSTGGWNIGSDDYYRVASAEEGLTVSKYDERIEQLDREAAENAYRSQIEHLFTVWMKDSTGQPARAATGAQYARKAFIDVMKAIEERAAKLRKLRELSPQN